MKRIINNALDALVNLDDKEDETSRAVEGAIDLTRRAEKMRSNHHRQQTAAYSKKEDFLAAEIKELEKILEFADYNKNVATISTKEDLILADQQLSKQIKKDEIKNRQQQQQQHQRREIESLSRRKDTKKTSSTEEETNTATASREEKAGIVIDNNNIRDLVDLVVRAIDNEARRDEEEMSAGNTNDKVESSGTSKFIKEAKVDAASADDVKKEKKSVGSKTEDHKRETTKDENTKALCNTRKRECVEVKKDAMTEETKKSTDGAKEDVKKTTTTTIEKKISKSSAHELKKDAVTIKKKEAKKEDKDSMEIRSMVDEILDGKNEEEREAFASLLEGVFERTKSSAITSDNKSKKSSLSTKN